MAHCVCIYWQKCIADSSSVLCAVYDKIFENAMHATTVRISCGRARWGQAQAAAPLTSNSAKLHCKSTARHQSIGTGDKLTHSVERAALRPGIALIKGKLSCFSFHKKNNEDWKGPVLISHWYHYTSRLLRETRWCVFSFVKKPPRLTPHNEFPWATLCALVKRIHRRPRLGANPEKT